MEKYTDRQNPGYIPGTYSIYSSAVIKQLQKLRERRRSSLTDSTNSSSIESRHEFAVEELTQQPYDLGLDYNYRYNPNIKLEMIPEIKTRYGIFLLPQPTNSPNDPLNWSYWSKAIHFIILMYVTALTAAISNNASTGQDSINSLTEISYNTLNNSAGVLFISIGISAWFYAPLASLCGRRLPMVISLIFGLFGSIWYAKMVNDGDSFGSQILIGFSEGVAEAQVPLCLSSILFRYQLGSVITIYILSYCLGTYLGPLVASYISDSVNYRWVGWGNAIASAVGLVLVTFLFEEDDFNYARFKRHTTEALLNFSLAQHGIVSNEDDLTLGFYDKKWSLKRRFGLIKPPESRVWRTSKQFFKQYLKLLIFNVRCLWFPPVLYAGIIIGLQNAILTFYLTTEDTELSIYPYNYSSRTIALMNIPCVIGSTIGSIYSGSITDSFILWMARHKKGIVQSEYRLYFAFLSSIIGAIGLLMFGLGIGRQLNWRVFYVGLGFISYMFSSASNLALLYVIDTYTELILETLVGVTLINNGIGCIFTFACSPWLDHSGVSNTYIALAAITLAIMLLTIPYLIWGKKWRQMTKGTYNDMIELRTAESKGFKEESR